MLIHLLAIPIGIVILFVLLLIVGLVLEYPVPILAVVFLIVIGYFLGMDLLEGIGII